MIFGYIVAHPVSFPMVYGSHEKVEIGQLNTRDIEVHHSTIKTVNNQLYIIFQRAKRCPLKLIFLHKVIL